MLAQQTVLAILPHGFQVIEQLRSCLIHTNKS